VRWRARRSGRDRRGSVARWTCPPRSHATSLPSSSCGAPTQTRGGCLLQAQSWVVLVYSGGEPLATTSVAVDGT
jgi:hypothetical protein